MSGDIDHTFFDMYIQWTHRNPLYLWKMVNVFISSLWRKVMTKHELGATMKFWVLCVHAHIKVSVSTIWGKEGLTVVSRNQTTPGCASVPDDNDDDHNLSGTEESYTNEFLDSKGEYDLLGNTDVRRWGWL